MLGIVEELPIDAYEGEILHAVEAQQVTVVQGDTGSGKSSRVPLMLLRHHRSSGSSRAPLVLVTQPRRIAAMSLARRVAEQLGERVGRTVGYSVGGEREGSRCPVRFVTTGWAVEKLIHAPHFLRSVTHLVLDEVHERSIDADLLHMLVKEVMLPMDDPPKLVLMSATFDAGVFQRYYMPDVVADELPRSLFVGVNRFPISIFHLEELQKCPTLSRVSLNVSSVSKSHLGMGGAMDKLFYQMVEEVHREHQGGVCVLVFLSGLAEIDTLFAGLSALDERKEPQVHSEDEDEVDVLIREEQLEDTGKEGVMLSRFQVLVLHSVIDKEDQMRVFSDVPDGMTRIILSTNIAESSVTIPNASYVVDGGRHKHMAYEPRFQCVSLQTVAISKAAAIQRAGRCGRVSPGTVLRMYSKREYEELPAYEQPDIQRLPLEETILRLKIAAEGTGNSMGKPSTALARTIDPPDVRDVHGAYERLVKYHMLDGEGEPDDLAITPLGLFHSRLSLDMRTGALIAAAVALQPGYLGHAVVLAVSINFEDLFVRPNPRLKRGTKRESDEYLRFVSSTQRFRLFYDAQRFSDPIGHLALYKAFLAETAGRNDQKKKRWCHNHGAHASRVITLVRQVREISRRLISALPEKHHAVLRLLVEDRFQPRLGERDVRALRFLLAHSMSDSLVSCDIEPVSVPLKRMGFTGKKVAWQHEDRCVFMKSVPRDLCEAGEMEKLVQLVSHSEEGAPKLHWGKNNNAKSGYSANLCIECDTMAQAETLRRIFTTSFHQDKLTLYTPAGLAVVWKGVPVQRTAFCDMMHATGTQARLDSSSIVSTYRATAPSNGWIVGASMTLVNGRCFYISRATLLDPALPETDVILALNPTVHVSYEGTFDTDSVSEVVEREVSEERQWLWVALKHALLAAVGTAFRPEGDAMVARALDNELQGSASTEETWELLMQRDEGDDWLVEAISATLGLAGEEGETEEFLLDALRFKSAIPELITRARLRDVCRVRPDQFMVLGETYVLLGESGDEGESGGGWEEEFQL